MNGSTNIIKQYNVGFLEIMDHPDWLPSTIIILRKDQKERMSVDYQDTNNANPKGNFLLPHINVLVDGTADHAVSSFMDCFSGYTEIKRAPEYKQSFITV